MLEPIHHQDGGNTSERYLAALARSHFLNLWVYPSLSKSAGPLTQELADLTVVFGDDVLLFEDKDKAWPEHPDLKTSWARYFRRSILDAGAQLWKAERYLRNRPLDVYLDKSGGHRFPFSLASAATRYHLIVVAGNSVEPCQRYFDEYGVGSSGSFYFNAALSADEIDEHPFMVGDLDPTKTFVHVLDRESLDLLFQELGSISDFIHYLSEKASSVRNGSLKLAAGEEEILSFYLQEKMTNGFGSLQRAKHPHDEKMLLHLIEGDWRAFKTSDEYRVHAQQHQIAAGWNELLETFTNAVIAANTGEADHIPIETHEATLRACAAENTASRARLASGWRSKLDTVPSNCRSSRLVMSMTFPGRLYVFLVVPWVDLSLTYQEYRQYRLQTMQAYANILPIKAIGVREAIIIATEPLENSDRRSETMIHVVYEQPLGAEEVAMAEELVRVEGILDIPQFIMPITEPALLGAMKYGRNDPCPCGSGKKNKKCCNIVGTHGGRIFGVTFGPTTQPD